MTCMYCEFRVEGALSLDVSTCEDATLMDMIPDAGQSMEDMVADQGELEWMIQRLKELDPEAEKIIALCREDDKISDRSIAKALNRPQRTHADHMKRIRNTLKRESR